MLAKNTIQPHNFYIEIVLNPKLFAKLRIDCVAAAERVADSQIKSSQYAPNTKQ
jgi:hypothetical protein